MDPYRNPSDELMRFDSVDPDTIDGALGSLPSLPDLDADLSEILSKLKEDDGIDVATPGQLPAAQTDNTVPLADAPSTSTGLVITPMTDRQRPAQVRRKRVNDDGAVMEPKERKARFVCPRCGYGSPDLRGICTHYSRIKPCASTYANTPLPELLSTMLAQHPHATKYVSTSTATTPDQPAPVETIVPPDVANEVAAAQPTLCDAPKPAKRGRKPRAAAAQPPSSLQSQPPHPPPVVVETATQELRASDNSKRPAEVQIDELIDIACRFAKRITSINLFPFGLESWYHVRASDVMRSINEPIQCIASVVRDIYLNYNFPENKTVRIIDNDKNNIHVHKGSGQWRIRDKNSTYTRMVENAINIIKTLVPDAEMPATMTEFMSEIDMAIDGQSKHDLLFEIDLMFVVIGNAGA